MRKAQSNSLILLLLVGFIVFVIPLFGLDAAISQPQPTWRSILGDWFSQEPKDRGTGRNSGGRPGDAICLITPVNNAQLWTTQPLLVWQGGYSAIGIRSKGSPSMSWEDAGSVKTQAGKRLSRLSKALVPGKEYEWGFFADQNLRSPIEAISFRVIDGQQRDEIEQALQVLEIQLKAQNASEEAIALERTNYFVKKRLWADALQEIYSVKQPSTELKKIIQDVEKKVCQEVIHPPLMP